MVLQIFGRKKSSETRKAIRYCKERSIEYQFIDVDEKEISPGELSSILTHVDPEELVDTGSTYYRKHGYEYLDYDPVEEVMEHPQLLRLPIIRTAGKAVLGYDEQELSALTREKQ